MLDVEHRRTGPHLPIQQVAMIPALETRDRAHCEALLNLSRAETFTVQPYFDLTGETRYPGV